MQVRAVMVCLPAFRFHNFFGGAFQHQGPIFLRPSRQSCSGWPSRENQRALFKRFGARMRPQMAYLPGVLTTNSNRAAPASSAVAFSMNGCLCSGFLGDTRKLRPPSFCNLSAIRPMLINTWVADAVVILGSLDIVMGEVDR